MPCTQHCRSTLRSPLSAVLAFLKRRWILLFSLPILVGLYSVRWSGKRCTALALTPAGQDTRVEVFILESGELYYRHNRNVGAKQGTWSSFGWQWGLPKLSVWPSMNVNPNGFRVGFPLWLPLCAVLGCLVIRELRWREKRAKAL